MIHIFPMHTRHLINSNMRCIEIEKGAINMDLWDAINSNMRCIEMTQTEGGQKR